MQHFTTSDGLSLAFVDQGQGPAVLCLAGLTRNHHDFDAVTAHLAGFRVIAMDYRGRGASDYAPDPMSYSVPVEARDALELLDHLKISKAAIIGTSRGGLIGMMLAATARARMLGVLLNDVGPDLNKDDLGRIVAYVGAKPPYRSLADAVAKMPAVLPGFDNISADRWAREIGHMFRETPDGLDILYDPHLRVSVEAAFNAPLPDLWPLFDALSGLPTALIRGANSQLLTAECAAQMCARRPDMLFANVPDRAHAPFLDEPESLAVLNTFLEKIK